MREDVARLHLEERHNLTWRPPMKDFKRCEDPWTFAHLKRDGHWTRIDVWDDGPRAYTRLPTEITGQLRACGLLDRFDGLPEGMSVACELWVKGHPASEVKRALKQRSPALQLEAFAVLRDPALSDEEVATMSLDGITAYRVPFVPFWSYRPGEHQPHPADMPLPDDAEGWVCKTGNLTGWLRYKPVNTIDLVVRGFTDGNGQHEGLVGSLECETIEGYPVASVGGMTMDERVDISYDLFDTDNPAKRDRVMGRVVEVRYQYVGAGGRLRHPAFLRFRDDKRPAECTASQDPKLVEYWSKR